MNVETYGNNNALSFCPLPLQQETKNMQYLLLLIAGIH